MVGTDTQRRGRAVFESWQKTIPRSELVILPVAHARFRVVESFEATARAMAAGRNQYPPMAGLPELRQGIAAKVEALYGGFGREPFDESAYEFVWVVRKPL